jgi:hypothetical protein
MHAKFWKIKGANGRIILKQTSVFTKPSTLPEGLGKQQFLKKGSARDKGIMACFLLWTHKFPQ